MTYEENDNIVMVGIKPFMNYVTAVKIQFDKSDEIVVCARGKFISKMFDVIEVCKRNFLTDYNVIYEKINVDSKLFELDNGKEIYVSSIEIKLIKKKK
jgi:DNA-binding protein Alba